MKVALVNQSGQFVKLWSKTRVVYTDVPSQAVAWSLCSSRLTKEKAKIISISGQPHAEVAHPDYRFVEIQDHCEVLECLSTGTRVVGCRLFTTPTDLSQPEQADLDPPDTSTVNFILPGLME